MRQRAVLWYGVLAAVVAFNWYVLTRGPRPELCANELRAISSAADSLTYIHHHRCTDVTP